jgi:hypothetical protein
MAKNAKTNRVIYVATACMAVTMFVLWWMVVQSVSIPFLYRQKGSVYIGLAYVQLCFLVTWMVIRNDLTHQRWALISRRDHWWAAGGAVILPLLIAYVLVLLFPLIASNLTDEVADKEFTYVTTEPYARTSRGLVQLKLVDDKGGEHWVVFKKERVKKLAVKCGDTLTTTGRSSFLGYVIDSEAKTNGIAKPCPQG